MTRFVDTIITYRILKKLVTPFNETEAYRLGIIDDRGRVLKKERDLKTDAEREAYTLLDRLVFRLKRIIEKVPVDNKRLVSLASALLLIREHVNRGVEPIELEREFINMVPDARSLTEAQEFLEGRRLTFAEFNEEIANVVGGGFSGQATPAPNANLAGADIVFGPVRRRKRIKVGNAAST